MVDELGEVLEGEDLTPGREEQLLHVLAADAESAAGNARDHFEPGLALWLTFRAEGGEVLDARHLVAGCSVVFGELRLDDDMRIELIWDDEVRCLVEPG